MSQSRREFLSRAGVIGGVAVTGTVGSLFTARAVNASQPPSGVSVGYGPLVQDPKGVLDLPSGFEYTVVSRAGEALTDPVGVVPGHQDGTGSFAAKDSTLLVINHEQSPGVPYPARAAANLTYDPAATGGTTTVRVGETNEKLAEYVSLAGTAVNCAGGVTPWGTWLTCEETEDRAGSKGYTKDHGWVFEVDPHNPENNTDPVPLKDLGRFAHEACCVDPNAGHVFLTEDANGPHGLFYRFTPKTLPNRLHSLRDGGTLEAMYVPGLPNLSTVTEPGTTFGVEWKAVPDAYGTTTSVRKQFTYTASDGTVVTGPGGDITRARKLEGAWWGGDGLAYFVSSYARTSDGSPAQHDGQVWAYDPLHQTVTLKVRFAVNPDTASDNPDGADNICYSPYGGLMLAEDGEGVNHLLGVTPTGGAYVFARNAMNDSEFTGVVFSPNGKTLFANIQDPGITFAITGPWTRRA